MQTCERCGKGSAGEYDLHDYCADCGKNLCDACMENGCCGHVPALSGMEADDEPETDPENIYGLPGIRQSIENDRK